MTLLMEGQAPRLGNQRINTHIVLVAAVLGAIIAIRSLALDYNTASADEASNLVVGQRIVHGDFRDNALQWMGGSYLYPVISAEAAQVGHAGVLGARALAVVALSVAALGVYVVARRIFGPTAALLALMIFGFSGVSIFAGTQATAGSFAAGLFSASAALLVEALYSQRKRAALVLMLGAAGCFTLAVLCAYTVLLWGLGVAALWFALLARRRWQPLRLLSWGFVVPVALTLGAYSALNWEALLLFVAHQPALFAPSLSHRDVLRQISYALRLPFVLALVGTGYALFARRAVRAPLLLLWGAALLAPLFWLVTAQTRAIADGLTYTLIFLAPLAGWATQQLLTLTPKQTDRQIVVLGFVVVYLMVGLQIWNDQMWLMQRAWPNAQHTIDDLRQLPISPATRVLAENGSVYDYYLGWSSVVPVTSLERGTFTYNSQQGDAALTAAIANRYFTYIILDGVAMPRLSAQLAQTAQVAGYQAVFQDAEIVPGVQERTYTITVYKLGSA